MATITSASFSPPADGQTRKPGLLAEIGAFWHQFFIRAFDPYRPELHYMRGPGPAWRAKHMASSPAFHRCLPTSELQGARCLVMSQAVPGRLRARIARDHGASPTAVSAPSSSP